ncbi:MAG: OprO/OprP family phosphate-selective porin [Odoribacteraceae bacterium]|jgi:phosphate-selective porin|nr:OprO/OprP family phosphate-selective porin [Odoribacteraceae bacterium]
MKAMIITTYITGIVLLMNTTGANAQNTEARVDKLEKIVAKLPSISGLINVRGQAKFQESGSGAVDVKQTSGEVRRARLDFKGGGSVLDYRLQVEFAKSPKILDAYVAWKVSEALNVQVGQYKIPFSLENPYGPTTLETVDNSTVITKLVNYDDVAGISANGRDIGISARGSFVEKEGGYRALHYYAGFFNGNGINNSDNDNGKDFSAIFTVKPFKTVDVAASFYQGSGNRWRFGVGARFENDRFLVRSEYITGETGDKDSEGYYGVVGYRVTPAVQLLVKYDYFAEDRQKSGNNTTILNESKKYLAGVRYAPAKNVHLMANYSYADIGNGTLEERLLTAQLVFAF